MTTADALDLFDTVPDTIDRGLCVCIYADPGIGKTTLIGGWKDDVCCYPGLDKDVTLVVSVDAGTGPLLGKEYKVFDLKSVAEKKYKGDILKAIDELYKFLRTGNHPFEYVVFDNISEFEQVVIQYLTQVRHKQFTEIKEYGDTATKVREVIHLFKDLTTKDINVVINAWELPIKIRDADGTVVTKTFPKISDKLARELCGIVDVVGHLEVYEKTGQRWIRFGPSDQYITKCQYKGLNEDGAEPPCLPYLFDKLRAYNYKQPTMVKPATKKGGK